MTKEEENRRKIKSARRTLAVDSKDKEAAEVQHRST
jgi:hypothetical protein